MNCSGQITESEGTFPVISAHAVVDSGRPFTARWIADETVRCPVGAPNPTTGGEWLERAHALNCGTGRVGVGAPSQAQMPDRPLSAAALPRHQPARAAPVRLSANPAWEKSEVPTPREAFHGVARLGEDCCVSGAVGDGSGRVCCSEATAAVGRVAGRTVRGSATRWSMGRGARAVCWHHYGQGRIPASLDGGNGWERSSPPTRFDRLAAHRSIPGPVWPASNITGRRRIPCLSGFRASDVAEIVWPGSRTAWLGILPISEPERDKADRRARWRPCANRHR